MTSVGAGEEPEVVYEVELEILMLIYAREECSCILALVLLQEETEHDPEC